MLYSDLVVMIEKDRVVQAIQVAIQDAEVVVINPSDDGLHFEAIVISQLFAGKSLLEQHQLVMNPLKELFHSQLHALTLKTYTPQEWKKTKR